MKRYVLMAIVLLFGSTMIFSSNAIDNQPVFDSFDFSIKGSHEHVENDLQSIVETMVPRKYVNTFNHYTTMPTLEDTINLRIHILAIGQIESEWTPAVSGINENGSYDIGYLQLNSYNLKNDLFLWKFSPKESDGFNYDTSDNMERYMIMCIKLYKSLYKSYGNDACYCYNGGEGRYLNNKIPTSTYGYQRRMSKEITIIVDKLEEKANIHVKLELAENLKKIGTFNLDYLAKLVLNKCSTTRLDLGLQYQSFNKPQDMLFDKRRVFAIQNAIYSTRLQVNKNYVFVGDYMKNTGAIAPVFLHRPSGKILYC